MIKIVSGKYGPKLLGPGTVLNLDEDTEKRLVSQHVAVYLDKESDPENTGEESNFFKTMEELQKIKSKKELIKYAERIGLHDLNESNKMDTLIDSIANYIEENSEE